MKKLLFLLILPSFALADRLGSLRSDADVLLTTQAVAGADNLGNHIATMTITAGQGIKVSTITQGDDSVYPYPEAWTEYQFWNPPGTYYYSHAGYNAGTIGGYFWQGLGSKGAADGPVIMTLTHGTPGGYEYTPPKLTTWSIEASSRTILPGATFYVDAPARIDNLIDNGLTPNLCVETDGNKQLVSAACGAKGGTPNTWTAPQTFISSSTFAGEVGVSTLTYKSLIPGTSDFATLSSSQTITPDMSLANTFSIVLGSSITINGPINASDSQNATFRITEGAAPWTVTWSSDFAFGTDLTASLITFAVNKTYYVGAKFFSSTGKWHVVSFIGGY